MRKNASPFWVIVRKEVADYLHSWRFYSLVGIIMLTCLGSLYTALSGISKAAAADVRIEFLFLRLFTVSDGNIPSFMEFIMFLGPLLGIGLGFDAINSERNKGTLSRTLAQPVPRDYVINAKFVASLLVIGVAFFALGLLVVGMGIIVTGLELSFEEFIRIIAYLLMSLVYVAFWLNLAILFSVLFKQPATAALAGIAIWLFFSIFYSMILNLIADAIMPSEESLAAYRRFESTLLFFSRFSPAFLFSEVTTTLLYPTVNRLNSALFATEQEIFMIPDTPLSIWQSMLVSWPQLTAMIALTLICFAISYYVFMRQEIRSRN